MPFILRHYNLFQVPLDDIYVGLWYIMLCVQNRRWYSKQVHFYSVFLSICYIAQNQCVSFHKVLQWFIFLQGLRVSKHTVFPVCKFKNQFTQVASSLLRSMWRWRRSFKCWVFFISSGRLLSLTNECLSWLHLLFLTVRAMSTTQIACYDYIDPHKLCSFVLKNPYRAPFWSYRTRWHYQYKGTLRSPSPPFTTLSTLWGWKAVSFVVV